MSDLSPKQAAENLGVSRSLVYRLVEQGEFPNAYQVSNRLRIPRADVDALRERKRVRPRRVQMYEPPGSSRAWRTSSRFADERTRSGGKCLQTRRNSSGWIRTTDLTIMSRAL
jgi:excisionase family DNA binding protein